MKKALKNILFNYFLAVFILISAWEVLSLGLGKPFFPGPWAAGMAFLEALGHGLDRHLLISTGRVVVSLAAALAAAAPLGMFLGREEPLDSLAAPLIYIIYPVPIIVFLPVIVTLFGIGNFSKIFIISIIVFFQILVTTRDAARLVSKGVIDSVVSLGASEWQIYRHVVFPACLPKILTALRIGLGTSIAVLFFSETIAGSSGVGYFIMDAWSRFVYDDMFAGIIAMGAMGLALYLLLDWLEKRLCPWEF